MTHVAIVFYGINAHGCLLNYYPTHGDKSGILRTKSAIASHQITVPENFNGHAGSVSLNVSV